MKIMVRALAMMAALLVANSRGLAADAPKYGTAADNRIFAQGLVTKLMAANPSLLTAGMHCVPPGGDKSRIVASTLNVIGKPSDPEDLDVGAKGFTTISPNLKVPKLGIMLPLHDRTGKIIGALALAFKFQPGEDQVKYFADATAIRDRVANEIPDMAALFAVTP